MVFLALRDRSLSEALLAVLEGVRLVSFRQFRKRRLALWAAGRGPDPHFTAMVFWPSKLYRQCWKVWDEFRKRRLALWAAGRGPDPHFTANGVLALVSLSEALLAVLEGVRLVSRQFRKRRLALGAAAAGPIRTSLPSVLALRDRSLSEALLAVLEGVRLVSRQFRKRRLALGAAGRGPDPYFTAMVFWPCETGDRSLSEALLAVLEGVRLVSRQFRKRRLALWAAGHGPDPHFTAMVFWPCETGLWGKLYWQCWKVWD